MQMTAILPTVFFIETEHGLCQRVQIELVNEGQAAQATLQVTGDQETETVDLGIIVAGHTTVDLYLRDRRTAQKLTFVLCSAGTVQSQQILDWQPQRHWEVHLIHYIHHDLGYTDIPSNVLREYDDHFDQVLRFCAETAPWPETDARFRFQCEQAWSLLHWIEHRPPEAVEQMIGFVKKGQIEVTALFGNMTLELCGHEEMIRLLYPAFALKHRYGIPITSAEHNDIPGFAWGLASVLAGAGIRYFSPGIPLWYFGEGEERVHPLWDTTAALPLTIPAACWWEGPDGQKVLLWSDLHGREWQPYNYDQALQELPQMLRHLEENEYPYEMVSYTLRGGHRDNAPPTRLFADLVREWNRRWAYPKLINTTNTPFLQKFEQRWGHTLKTLRGDVPGTDYPVAATCTPKETALSRNSHDALVTAETLATLASCLGDYAYPQATLQEAYRQLFYYDEHCWGLAHVGGPAMDAHWSDKSNFVYKAAALAHDITIKAANKLVDQINLPTDDWSIVIFNPLAHTRTDVVRVPLRAWSPAGSPMFWQAPHPAHPWPELRSGRAVGRRILEPPLSLFDKPFEIVDSERNQCVVYQISRVTDPQAATPWAAERVALAAVDQRHEVEIVFLAEDLPALGYKRYHIRPRNEWPYFVNANVATDTLLENRYFQVTIDPVRGVIASLIDQERRVELVDGAAPYGFGQLIVRLCATGTEEVAQIKRVALVEDGPVCATLHMIGEASCCPHITLAVTLYHGLKRIDVNMRALRNGLPLRELFLAFPFLVEQAQFHFEATNAVIEPTVDQWPGSNSDAYAVQHWVHIGNAGGGIVWTPLDAPMAEFGGLWPGYVSGAHHGVTGPGYGHPFLPPGELTSSHIYSLVSYNNFRTNFLNVQPGEFLVRYAFTAQCGDWRNGQARTFGWNVANPPLAVWLKGPQTGVLHTTLSYCQIDAPNITLLACKRAEDGDGVILRLIETEGKETLATITLPQVAFSRVFVTNLVEENLCLLAHHNHSIQAPLQPYAIATLRLA